jgi:hypothetical protein
VVLVDEEVRMTVTDAVTRDSRREPEQAERTWPCTGRAAQWPGQRAAAPGRLERGVAALRRVAPYVASTLGILFALPLAFLFVIAIALPLIFIGLVIMAALVGIDLGGGTGGGD